jgi:hypothetical protein
MKQEQRYSIFTVFFPIKGIPVIGFGRSILLIGKKTVWVTKNSNFNY